MIRLLTLEVYEPKILERLSKMLYAAFGVGTEYEGLIATPPGHEEPLDAAKLLKDIDAVRTYADDKLLYITQQALRDRELPSGKTPTTGYCHYNGERALISTAGLVMGGEEAVEDDKRAARNALHQVGHLWELHHCLDPRCAMYPPWTPSFQTGEAVFCNFCRDKSEQKLRLAKS